MKNLKTTVVFISIFLLSSISAFAKSIQVVLSLSARVPMSQLASNVTDPDSVRYGQFYSLEEIRALAAPSDSDYSALVSNLKADGFKIVYQAKSHLFLTISGDHSLFEKVFNTQIRFSSSSIHKNIFEPEVPARYSLVESVTGLDNTRRLKPRYKMFVDPDLGAKKHAAPTQPGILPAQIKTAYGFNPIYQSGITGQGQNIAIATYMGFHIEDVQAYYSMVGLPSIPTVDQVTFNGTPAYDADSAVETQLDSEFTGMIAPGASIHVFASAENSDAGELAMMTAILDDGRSKQVNYSWGSCETQVAASHKSDMDKVYAQAVAQGVNFLAASGDNGSDDCGDGTKAVNWPASSPNVVAIGGTTLSLSSADSITSEIGWGYIDPNSGSQEGSGGGISVLYSVPSWQTGLPSQFSKMRSVPDVSFNADPNSGEAVWTHMNAQTGKDGASASWLQIGGTSMATPQWTGFLALVNSARAAKSLANLGYLNPIIYKLSAAQKASLLNDIISGNNGAYSCASGWDAVTGWGSMQGSNLFNYLLGL